MSGSNGSWKEAALGVIDDWDGTHVITSPDVDGILSYLAVRIARPGARLAGIYTTSHVLLFDGFTREEAREAIWLDHDISQPGIRCMGQHLVNLNPDDKLPRRHPVSFNPNVYYKQGYGDSFKGKNVKRRDKYPFATCHFLFSALNLEEPEPGTPAYHLLAHADGTWGTCKDYEKNTRLWYDTMFDGSDLVISDLVMGDYCSSGANLERHSEIVQSLRDLGISSRKARENPSSAIPIEWQHLQGNQGIQFTKRTDHSKWLSRFNGILGFCAEQFGERTPLPRSITEQITGRVETPYPNSIPNGDLDGFMMRERIFSHAIKSFRMMRFTTDLEV
ncbi:MAG: hypothetical protein CMA28_01460 [Euryarchaeota archaeon]|nr:hypothetical protein [Euryarchaeota archaeon]|tara:strand:- start:1299 stop:2297 length:999 start_codon:yes stop_codon:yes gene_type:complete